MDILRPRRLLFGTAAAALTAMTTTLVSFSPPAEAACPRGQWRNSDGTCTYVNYVHCNVKGVKWQCPRTKPRCVLVNGGNKQCRK